MYLSNFIRPFVHIGSPTFCLSSPFRFVSFFLASYPLCPEIFTVLHNDPAEPLPTNDAVAFKKWSNHSLQFKSPDSFAFLPFAWNTNTDLNFDWPFVQYCWHSWILYTEHCTVYTRISKTKRYIVPIIWLTVVYWIHKVIMFCTFPRTK